MDGAGQKLIVFFFPIWGIVNHSPLILGKAIVAVIRKRFSKITRQGLLDLAPAHMDTRRPGAGACPCGPLVTMFFDLVV